MRAYVDIYVYTYVNLYLSLVPVHGRGDRILGLAQEVLGRVLDALVHAPQRSVVPVSQGRRARHLIMAWNFR